MAQKPDEIDLDTNFLPQSLKCALSTNSVYGECYMDEMELAKTS
jgi:hypothetical protein